MKVFISQPMQGLTDKEILKAREEAIKYAKSHIKIACDDSLEFINSFFPGAVEENRPLWNLGRSLQLLSEADVCLFIGNWVMSRGCRIEHECCLQYGIKAIYK